MTHLSPLVPLEALIFVLVILMLFGFIALVFEKKAKEAERKRLRAEEDKKYENQVMYDGKALSWLDQQLSRVRDGIETIAYNTVKKSGRKLVTVADMKRAIKQFKGFK